MKASRVLQTLQAALCCVILPSVILIHKASPLQNENPNPSTPPAAEEFKPFWSMVLCLKKGGGKHPNKQKAVIIIKHPEVCWNSTSHAL